MASATPITDPERIREWAEAHGGRPACVKGTTALLRIDFGEPDEKLQPISWEQWSETFERRRLAALIQEDDERSRFFKLVDRRSAASGRGGRAAGSRGRRAAKGARVSSARKSGAASGRKASSGKKTAAKSRKGAGSARKTAARGAKASSRSTAARKTRPGASKTTSRGAGSSSAGGRRKTARRAASRKR
jgi:hypothetical protein